MFCVQSFIASDVLCGGSRFWSRDELGKERESLPPPTLWFPLKTERAYRLVVLLFGCRGRIKMLEGIGDHARVGEARRDGRLFLKKVRSNGSAACDWKIICSAPGLLAEGDVVRCLEGVFSVFSLCLTTMFVITTSRCTGRTYRLHRPDS